MSRARELSRLGDTNALGIQTGNLRVGSAAAGTKLEIATNMSAGIVTAAQYFGDGSGLTGLVAVSGIGITILDDDVSKGAITKLNFGNYFTVSTPNSGIATVTVGVDTGIILAQSAVVQGITTTANLNVTGFATFSSINVGSGIVTAGNFVGIATGATEANTAFGLSGSPNVIIGFSTATKISTTDLDSTHINVTGITTTGLLSATSLNVSGFATATEVNTTVGLEVIGFTTITNGGLETVGVVTATNFVGNLTGDIIGDLTGNVTGDLTGNVTGNLTGTATTASSLSGVPNINVGFTTATKISTTDLDSTHLNITGISTVNGLFVGEIECDDFEIAGFTTVSKGGVTAVGIVTATGGFVSAADTSPVQISLIANELTFTVAGIGSTTLILY